MADQNEEKTTRIGIVCATIAFLAIVGALSKSGCGGCSMDTPSRCHDEWHEMPSGGSSTVTCDNGAVAEVVTSPPAPKPGILCHCVSPAGSASAPPAPPSH